MSNKKYVKNSKSTAFSDSLQPYSQIFSDQGKIYGAFSFRKPDGNCIQETVELRHLFSRSKIIDLHCPFFRIREPNLSNIGSLLTKFLKSTKVDISNIKEDVPS